MAEDVTLKIDLLPTLYQVLVRWADAELADDPTAAQVLGGAATMFYMSASLWQRFEPPNAIAAYVKMDEEAFLDLARQMWRKSLAPTPQGRG